MVCKLKNPMRVIKYCMLLNKIVKFAVLYILQIILSRMMHKIVALRWNHGWPHAWPLQLPGKVLKRGHCDEYKRKLKMFLPANSIFINKIQNIPLFCYSWLYHLNEQLFNQVSDEITLWHLMKLLTNKCFNETFFKYCIFHLYNLNVPVFGSGLSKNAAIGNMEVKKIADC